MKKSIIFDLLKLLFLGIIIWVVFYFFPVFPDKPKLDISIDNEEKLGKIIVENILSHDSAFKEIHTPPLDSAIKIISQRLLDSIGLTDYDFHIRVIDNPEINAVTLPGGNIFVFKGLIKFSESPEEVAAVISHEMGHVEHRDVVYRLAQEFGLTMLVSIVTGGDNVMAAEIARATISTAFDRRQEKEADLFGLDLMVKAKINPKAMAVFFRRLNRKDEKSEKIHENLEFLMTHPHNNSRIKTAMEFPVPDGFKDKKFGLNWERVKNSCASH